MSQRSTRRARAALWTSIFGIGAVALVEAACSSPDASTLSADDTEALSVQFETAYSAFDGVHEYKIPAKVDGVKKPKWSASPASLVKLEPQSDGTVMITTLGAGVVTITAKSGSLSGTSKLTIEQASAEEWQAGSDRYSNGIVFQRPDGGRPEGGGGGGGQMANPSLACTNCHANGKADVEHTPMQTGGYSDDDLIMIFTQGKKPAGVPQRVMPADRWQKIHEWKMEPEEQRGLVWYLRSLEPESQGPVDWGGRGKGSGSSSSSSSSGSSSSSATSH